ncbi:MAG: aminoacyl-tRNA hydrolase [Planctomycetaceae bacterium]|nr:aminoacyl-tRNA hydrolase [Planctomycetaceae bacterium]MCB9949753.1 aminoacyl-tRNA hydrolase [Planctomycetaceae bacterium]
MRLVVGLGNPGSKYDGTRHNIGFDAILRLAESELAGRWKSQFEGQVTEVGFGADKTILLAPHTYMNLSGRSVKSAVQFYKLFPEEVLVICDDMNLPLGKLRMKAGGSGGGQKGLQNILEQLGTQQVPRLRLGIGRPSEGLDPANYVLKRFSQSELDTVDVLLNQAVQATRTWVTDGIVTAMNKFNSSQTE